uniref:Flagellar assembly protein H n=1 Tax=Paenibacillus polymyxa TaxID=1406 RepID=A0AAE9TEW4_PAEPO
MAAPSAENPQPGTVALEHDPQAFQQGYDAAYNEGFNSGFAKGYEDGHQLAYKAQ